MLLLKRYLFSFLAYLGIDVAQNYLGFMYEEGRGGKRDYIKAAYWYRKASQQNNIFAHSNLARLLARETGQENSPEIIDLYRKSANGGHAWSQNHLATILTSNPDITAGEVDEAVRLYKAAAESGNGWAMLNLSELYYKGDLVEQNFADSFLWAEKASKTGLPQAQYKLAQYYENGIGTDSNLTKADQLYSDAEKNGYRPFRA